MHDSRREGFRSRLLGLLGIIRQSLSLSTCIREINEITELIADYMSQPPAFLLKISVFARSSLFDDPETCNNLNVVTPLIHISAYLLV